MSLSNLRKALSSYGHVGSLDVYNSNLGNLHYLIISFNNHLDTTVFNTILDDLCTEVSLNSVMLMLVNDNLLDSSKNPNFVWRLSMTFNPEDEKRVVTTFSHLLNKATEHLKVTE